MALKDWIEEHRTDIVIAIVVLFVTIYLYVKSKEVDTVSGEIPIPISNVSDNGVISDNIAESAVSELSTVNFKYNIDTSNALSLSSAAAESKEKSGGWSLGGFFKGFGLNIGNQKTTGSQSQWESSMSLSNPNVIQVDTTIENANPSSLASVEYFLEKITGTYQERLVGIHQVMTEEANTALILQSNVSGRQIGGAVSISPKLTNP